MQGKSASSKRKQKNNKVEVVKVILGAKSLGDSAEPAPDSPTVLPTSSSSSKKSARPSEPFQLLRPRSDVRDLANVKAANLLDSNFELARDISPVEKALLPGDTTFRVIGALGGTASGRSTLLSSVLTPNHNIITSKFPSKSLGMNVFVQTERRIMLVDFPPVCCVINRKLDTPMFAVQGAVDPAKYYDLRVAFAAITTCDVVLVVVNDREDKDKSGEALRTLLHTASKLAQQLNYRITAQFVFVRNFVPAMQSLNQRRIQCDERLVESKNITNNSAKVIHVPQRDNNNDGEEEECVLAQQSLARAALSSFAAVDRKTEAEWLSQLVHVFNETRSHEFFLVAHGETLTDAAAAKRGKDVNHS